MFSAKHHLTFLPPQALDAYLEKGWFRMNQTLFITHFLHFDGQFYPAVWLRYPLKNEVAALVEKKLKPIQSRFSIRVKPWVYSPDQEELFSVYREQAGIDLTPTLYELLMGNGEVNVFNTLQVELLDYTRLVALGIFDIGEKSAAGITNIYHPDYRKHSLGKALMYAKMQYSLQQGLDWFYPGYAVPGRSRFNYKLDIAPNHTEYFCPVRLQWVPHNPSGLLPNLLQDMERELILLQEKLLDFGTNSTLVYYRHFDAKLAGLDYTDLLASPIFLLFGYHEPKTQWMIGVYDVVSGTYSLLFCQTMLPLGATPKQENLLVADILQVSELLATGLDIFGMIEILCME